MAAINLTLDTDDIDFLMAVLTQQPLPYVRTAPLVNKIGSQVQLALAQAQQPHPDANPPAGGNGAGPQ
jgi:hypothetical protein